MGGTNKSPKATSLRRGKRSGRQKEFRAGLSDRTARELMSEHGATDYDKWFHGEYDTEEAERADYMAAVEEVYRDTHQWAGRWDENERQLAEAIRQVSPS